MAFTIFKSKLVVNLKKKDFFLNEIKSFSKMDCNELFDLAGEDYVFNIMLDDTYILNGDIRNFLTIARSDDEADSYSIFIKDDFMTFILLNRILRNI